jgi:hypothetical protein
MSRLDGKALCVMRRAHAFRPVGLLIVLPTRKDARRVTLQCPDCGTMGYDTWARTTGGRAARRHYARPKDYQAYLGSHDGDGARLDVMATMKETTSEAGNSRLRLVQGAHPRRRHAAAR